VSDIDFALADLVATFLAERSLEGRHQLALQATAVGPFRAERAALLYRTLQRRAAYAVALLADGAAND
jgi:hypothetical protein